MGLIIIIGVVVWVATMTGWYLLTTASKSADVEKAKSRLLGTTAAKKSEKGGSKQPALFDTSKPQAQLAIKLLHKYNLHTKAEELLEQAGVKWKVARLVHFCTAGFIAGYFVPYLFAPPFMRPYLLLTAAIGAFLPVYHVIRLRKKRLHAFEGIFPDCLEFIARSMRAGHAFSVSLEMIYREFQEPLAGEFRRTFEEHNLGLPLDVALQKLAKRVPLLDVQFFVSAVLLQKRTGGNLAEILDKLAYVIRERFKLRGRIRAVSAHGRMTGLALTCIPIAVGILMFFTNPDYVTFFFTDETGQIMAAAAIGLQVTGYLIIKKIVT
ncbi:MAG TPA: type II secretion system F family protein, partial [Bryobacteraceae bacterium]|nr:type II secretion system F family protein [Bryobacteraceae bacterium]